ncbi:hypothetical protein [Desulfovibrio gilichinskyi]|uniref:Uncharacterized protein n=1 Tax=Desulfovibrio gilichinskyi TaxID=1519643 RepID=A0A1X7F1Q7_9BACT|nr:hypothetical protein [Desulfovibrio gilichinskyi]SMF44391.1 hypothetical protein SAMN06295933_3594 [Desulfovibrio gilichinskyi]
MKKDEQSNTLENPALAIKGGHELVICEDCGEELVFSMQDNYYQFTLILCTKLRPLFHR